MGADLIYLGYTRDEATKNLDAAIDYIKALTDEQALGLVLSGDTGGFYDADEAGASGDFCRAHITEAANALDYEGGRVGATFPIKGSYYFVFQGDATWGDSPFDEFDDACILLDATTPEAVEIRRLLGIIGGGIVIPGEGDE